MTHYAIRACNLTKVFSLTGHNLRPTLKDSLKATITAWTRGNPTDCGGPRVENSFRALNDISFDITPGEVVGIIGPNGGGKSTLLKTIAGITYPSSGYVELHGRVSSILEVGTGFHLDLTGAENIYLSGAILGMKSFEIRKKFDQIVNFSGIERFIDTPVKHYSSGMYLRLGFAISAHLSPDIMLVDEVISAGDLVFRQQCFETLKRFAKEGKTILFVSHEMEMVRSLCPRVLWIEEGSLSFDGSSRDGVAKYCEIDGNIA